VKDLIVATVDPDGRVRRGSEAYEIKATRRSKPAPGQRWQFLRMADGRLHPMAPVEEIDMPAAELLQRLIVRVRETPEAFAAALAQLDPLEAGPFLQAAALHAPIAALLRRLSDQLLRDRRATASAIVAWCANDAAARSAVLTALEATSLGDPNAPMVLVRRTGPNSLDLGRAFANDIQIAVSPNGRLLRIRPARDASPAPPPNVRVPGLSERSPWPGEPYDVLLRWDGPGRSYIGVLARAAPMPGSAVVEERAPEPRPDATEAAA
jgi:hypothetical protein